MALRPSAERTAELLLWYFREPSRYVAEGRRRDAPPLDAEVVLKLALGRRIAFANPALEGSGIAATLQDAAALYVRHLYFRPGATPYQTLGLAPGASPQEVRESFRLLMQLVHPDRQDARVLWPDAHAALANRAYGILRNQDSRARFDREAEARAALARTLYRSAARSASSTYPVVLRPKARFWSGAASRSALPEWLTAGVGGLARGHPSAIAFTVLIAGAVLVVAGTAPDGPEAAPAWEVTTPFAPAASTVAAAAREPAGPTEAAPRRFEPVAARDGVGAQSRVAVSGRISMAATSPPELDDDPAPPAIARPIAGPGEAPSAPLSTESPAYAASASLRADETAPAALPSVPQPAPATAEIEALIARFIESYEKGRPDAFAALFDADAETNIRHGRAAIRGEYDELFRLSDWRRMQLTRVDWRSVGDRAVAKGEMAVRIGWRDGREVEQRVAVDMELVRQDGRALIAKLYHRPSTTVSAETRR